MKTMILFLFSLSIFAGSIKVKEPFIRLLPPSAPNTGGFLTIINEGKKDIKLVEVKSDLSKKVELHDHVKVGTMMQMREVESILVKAGSKTVLEPGSLHIMFMGLKKKLVLNNKIPLELIFSDKSRLKIEAPILDK